MTIRLEKMKMKKTMNKSTKKKKKVMMTMKTMLKVSRMLKKRLTKTSLLKKMNKILKPLLLLKNLLPSAPPSWTTKLRVFLFNDSTFVKYILQLQ